MDTKDLIQQLQSEAVWQDRTPSITRKAADALEAQQAEIERLRGALNDIANPVVKLREEAERCGATLNGVVALSISNDAGHLKGIARAALEDTQ
jgi:hypothetical protein